jgi:hypothetical protein
MDSLSNSKQINCFCKKRLECETTGEWENCPLRFYIKQEDVINCPNMDKLAILKVERIRKGGY